MSSHAFGAFIDHESSDSGSKGNVTTNMMPIAPQKAKPRSYHGVPLTPSDIELEHMQWGAKFNEPTEITSNPPSGTQTPHVMDLEMSRPPSPSTRRNEVEALQSFWRPKMNRFRMVAVCLANLCSGLSDAAPGALIPYIETHYNIGYAVVSLIFITNAVGFISAAIFVDAIRARFGRAKSLLLACAFMTCGYIPIVCTPPFAVVVACFFFLGFGMAINLALGNVFAANLQNGTTMLGAMHGSYGVGGTIGPLMATAMVTKGHLVWSRYYLIPLSFTVFNGCFALWSFWDFEAESAQATDLLTSLERLASRTQNSPSVEPSNQITAMLKSFKSRVVMLGALFIFAYQGAEVSISGWVISFLISARGGDPSSVGYVTAGFWAGITLGRFLLSAPAHKIGEKKFVYGVVVGAAAFQLLVWFVPNIIGNAVAVSIVGLLLGPVYPCACTIFTRLIPRKEQVSGLSVISAFGSSGGAVAPFTTGILAQAAGTFVLHPIAIGLFGVMLATWYILPAEKVDRDE